jgi:hypothetical protein
MGRNASLKENNKEEISHNETRIYTHLKKRPKLRFGMQNKSTIVEVSGQGE